MMNHILKILLITLLVSLNNNDSVCQNLVPNPSFEDYNNCPSTLFNLSDVNLWQNFRESPDYFNACANVNNPGLGVPNNVRGTQAAIDGLGYIGLICFGKSINNIREHAGVQLLQPLIQGQKYFISFFVSLSDTVSFNCAINKLGIKFSTFAYSVSNPSPIDNIAQLYSDSIILEKNSWFRIYGSFISDSSYTHLIVGNFFDDNQTDTAECSSPNSSASNYYIDALCLSTDSLFCSNLYSHVVEEQFQTAIINSNYSSATHQITISGHIQKMKVSVFNSMGSLCLSEICTDNKINIDTNNLSNGLYIIKLQDQINSFIIKILIH